MNAYYFQKVKRCAKFRHIINAFEKGTNGQNVIKQEHGSPFACSVTVCTFVKASNTEDLHWFVLSK